jgi:uncharacterized oligopeptide transporter (OPT) family protein
MAQLGGRRGGIAGAGLLAAAGLITGEALMGIFIAIPIAASGQGDILAAGFNLGMWPGLLLMSGLCLWLWSLAKARD